MDIFEYETRVKRGFRRREDTQVVWFDVPSVADTGKFVLGFTTRIGGVSPKPWNSLNLSKTREPSEENKAENYRRVARALGIDPTTLALVNYEHGDGIVRVTATDAGKGFIMPIDYPHCDALIVDQPGVTAVTLHADCVPVFVVDPVGGRIAIGHAGWKGTALRLPEKMVRILVSNYGSCTQDLLVAIGPHIRSCCFEVGDDVASVFVDKFGPWTVEERDGRKYVNLERAILSQFSSQGLSPEQVTVSEDCTYCNPDLYYSHRRDKGVTGAMGSFAAVTGDF